MLPLYVGPQFNTAVWISEEVADRVREYQEEEPEEANEYLSNVKHYATHGFMNFEGPKKKIRSKGSTWPGILAIQPWETLFRLYGFYEQPQKRDFIVPSCTMKVGKKMNKTDKRECDYALDVKEKQAWEKVEPTKPAQGPTP
jgi:hypothetical protein